MRRRTRKTGVVSAFAVSRVGLPGAVRLAVGVVATPSPRGAASPGAKRRGEGELWRLSRRMWAGRAENDPLEALVTPLRPRYHRSSCLPVRGSCRAVAQVDRGLWNCPQCPTAHSRVRTRLLAPAQPPHAPPSRTAPTRTRAPPGPPGRTPPSPVTPLPSAKPRAACPQLQRALGAHGRTQRSGVAHAAWRTGCGGGRAGGTGGGSGRALAHAGGRAPRCRRRWSSNGGKDDEDSGAHPAATRPPSARSGGAAAGWTRGLSTRGHAWRMGGLPRPAATN